MKLETWMRENRYSDPAFAREVSKVANHIYSARSVENWRRGFSMPRFEAVEAMRAVTAGAVTYEDHVEVAKAYKDRKAKPAA
jgi:hypothetical protein